MRKFIILCLFSQIVWAQQYNLMDAEYFWGQTDPGHGQGARLNAADGSFNSAVEEIITNYNVTQIVFGPALFNIRVKDANGKWGPTFKKVVFIGGVTETPQQVTITAFEFYFGNFDPGEGNGSPIVAFDGALDSAVEEVFRNQATWDVTSGPVLFNIRAKDSDGHWGPVFKKTVFPYGANPNAQLIAEGDSIEICPGSTVTLTYNGPFGYKPTWFDGSQENTITFTPTEEGAVSCSASLGGSTYTDSINITFKSQPEAIILITGTNLVCSSSNFSFQANSGSGLSYQWYLNGNTITNATSQSYLPTALGSYTVAITDSSTGCSAISAPTILTNSFSIISEGSNDFCSEKEIMVPFGNNNSYQWKKNNVNIEGATNNVYLAKESGSYECIITNNNCSTKSNIINLNSINPTKPNGETTQSFNVNETLNNITVTGENIKWYNSPENGAILDLNTILEDGKTYYASQTINGCESKERLSITTKLNTLSNGDYFINGLVIYPNPTENNISVEANETFNKIEIFNMLGQKIEVISLASAKSINIALNKYKSGVYFIYIFNNKKYSVKSIVKK